MHKFGFLYILLALFLATSFHSSSAFDEVYELKVEAGGCHYLITVNDQMVLDGKSYQSVQKKFKINEQLTKNEEQFVDVHMYRISREIPLKATKAFVNLRLEKTTKDSTILVKELKLPTFAYDDDVDQPQSISGSILFKTNKTTERTAKVDSLRTK